MDYLEERPVPPLRPYLECVWRVAGRASAPEPQRIVPDGCPELIVHLADPFSRKAGTRWVRQPRVFLAATLSRPWLVRPGPRVLTFGLRFRPGAITSLFAFSMAGLADREVPLPAPALAAALARARGDARRFAAAQAWLLGRLREATPPEPSARPAVALVLKDRGSVGMAAVAKALGWTPRRLERVFLRDLGIRPKLFARIVRLNAVLATLDDAERGSAVDLALDAGYFDQAHLLRDFRRLAGRSPRAGSSADGALARHFTHPERLRALFAPE